MLECYVHPYDRDTLHNVKSVSKSVMSALVGIALREGILTDLDQPLSQFLPQYFEGKVDPRKRRLTFRHLLTMTAGLDLDENGPIERQIFEAEDWVAATLARPMTGEPGTSHLYSTPLSHIVSMILTEASGKTLLELGREHLFGPLGIDRVQWSAGPQGYSFGGAELFLTPRSMARFGLLYLNQGRFAGRQIVPREWVEESLTGHVPQVEGRDRYGYWWWVIPRLDMRLAAGWGGQVITLQPATDNLPYNVIKVSTAAGQEAAFAILREAGRPDSPTEPLPPNPSGVAALETLLAELENPAARPIPPHPPLARKISGRRYSLAENRLGFEALTFLFEDEASASVRIERTGYAYEAAIGLDWRYRITATGAIGSKPEDNHYAFRGEWTDEATFLLEFQQIANPFHFEARFTFEGNVLRAEILGRPGEIRVPLTGTTSEDRP